MRPSLKQVWWFLRDRLYPMLEPLSDQEVERQWNLSEAETAARMERVAALPEDETILATYLNECARLLNEEGDVRRGVEGRLTSIVGLSSIAGTIVFSGILAVASGGLHAKTTLIRAILTIGALYLTLQICRAIWAGVCGLERRAYITETASDILPLSGEARPVYLRREINAYAKRLEDDRRQREAKVEQMALAHCAMKNFVGGLILFAMFGTCFALSPKNQGEDLIQTLKQDRALYEMLRGPQGPKGDPGPQGPMSAPSLPNKSSPKQTSPQRKR